MSHLTLAADAAAMVVLSLLVLVLLYQGLARRRNQAEHAWTRLDAQLTRRYGLVPDLLQVAQRHAPRHQVALAAVTAARERALDACGPADRAAAETDLTEALHRVVELAENCPALAADDRFQQLREELRGAEGRIADDRRRANDAVLRYNTAISTAPAKIVAALLRLRGREYFEVVPSA